MNEHCRLCDGRSCNATLAQAARGRSVTSCSSKAEFRPFRRWRSVVPHAGEHGLRFAGRNTENIVCIFFARERIESPMSDVWDYVPCGVPRTAFDFGQRLWRSAQPQRACRVEACAPRRVRLRARLPARSGLRALDPPQLVERLAQCFRRRCVQHAIAHRVQHVFLLHAVRIDDAGKRRRQHIETLSSL
jgi:hypothetical protein